MLRCVCPNCNAANVVPDDEAGGVTDCLLCGQSLAVPRGMPLPAVSVQPKRAIPIAAVPVPSPPPSSPTSSPRPSRRKRITPFAGAVAAVTIAALVLGYFLISYRPRPGAVAEKRSDTRTDEEELVKRWILRSVPEPKAVEFVKWGPHMAPGEYAALLKEAGFYQRMKAAEGPGDNIDNLAFVRVVVRRVGTDKTEDCIVAVMGRMMLPTNTGYFLGFGEGINNPYGDGWRIEVRRELGKRFPGINSP